MKPSPTGFPDSPKANSTDSNLRKVFKLMLLDALDSFKLRLQPTIQQVPNINLKTISLCHLWKIIQDFQNLDISDLKIENAGILMPGYFNTAAKKVRSWKKFTLSIIVQTRVIHGFRDFFC